MTARSLSVVSIPHGDEQLRLIADTLAERFLVDDLEQLGSVLDAQNASGARALELIGHSTAVQRRLKLGQTEISADDDHVVDFFRSRRDHLKALGISEIRLLGCCTAVRPEGQAAMRAIATASDLRVRGATTIISSTAYDRDGLTQNYASTYLADQDHPPILATCPLDPVHASGTVGPLEIDSLETVALRVTSWPLIWPRDQKLSRILPGLVDPTGLSMPGLLVEPDIELLIPTGSGFRRVDVLLGGAAVRVFPEAHPCGVIYRVVEPGPLDALMRPHRSAAQRAPLE